MRRKQPTLYLETFLLGAGASFGHQEQDEDSPPLLNRFLSRAAIQNCLTLQRFPALSKACVDESQMNDLQDACTYLEATGRNIESFLETGGYGAKEEAYFFVHEYIGRFCRPPLPENSAYRTLARYVESHQNSVGGVISLNYDILGDLALSKYDPSTLNYCLKKSKDKKFLYLKPHGSVNFRLSISNGIDAPFGTWDAFTAAKVYFIAKNRITGRPFDLFVPEFDLDRDFFDGRSLNYLPGLLPPFGSRKDYEQFSGFRRIWDEVRRLLQRTSQLTVIGCAMNASDVALWKVIENNLPEKSQIRVIGKDHADAINIGMKFDTRGFKNCCAMDCNGFLDYATNYLGGLRPTR